MKVKFEKKEEEKEPLILSMKDANRHRILKIIKKEGPQRFKDLQEKSNNALAGMKGRERVPILNILMKPSSYVRNF